MATTSRRASTRKSPRRKSPAAHGNVRYINPEGLPPGRGYTQVVAASGPVKTIYVGAQTAVDGTGALVGKGDIAAQTEQVLRNVEICLRAAGAKPQHIVQWSIYLVEGTSVQAGFEAAMRWWGPRPNPPANTVIFVHGFPLLPDVLVMIDAVAVVPD
jgi:enamine deaminase RidA (YjgF/YER057c/UK114 family)